VPQGSCNKGDDLRFLEPQGKGHGEAKLSTKKVPKCEKREVFSESWTSIHLGSRKRRARRSGSIHGYIE